MINQITQLSTQTPLWVKTISTSVFGLASGFGISLSDYADEIKAWGYLITMIVVPLASLGLHFYKTLNKKD